MYLQEVQKYSFSLTRINDVLSAFNLLESLVNQVKLLAREVTNKDKVLVSAQASISSTKASLSAVLGDLENLRLENLSLAQKLDEVSNVGLNAFYESFENALLQIEHFYSPLHISRE